MEHAIPVLPITSILETAGLDHGAVKTHAPGPQGALPITPEMLLTQPSGNLFGLSQNAGMGWDPRTPARPGVPHPQHARRPARRRRHPHRARLPHRALGGRPAGRRSSARAEALQRAFPLPEPCTDPCDGRTQGTAGMLDSLPYRNDAAIVLRRLMRSLPTRKGVIGIATCDKGLPAMMMALASSGATAEHPYPRRRNAAARRRRRRGQGADHRRPLRAEADHARIRRRSRLPRLRHRPGGGCQFLGTAATSQVVGEALGLSLPHTALAPSGQPIWLDAAHALCPRHPAHAPDSRWAPRTF